MYMWRKKKEIVCKRVKTVWEKEKIIGNLSAFPPFIVMFSKGQFSRIVKSRDYRESKKLTFNPFKCFYFGEVWNFVVW